VFHLPLFTSPLRAHKHKLFVVQLFYYILHLRPKCDLSFLLIILLFEEQYSCVLSVCLHLIEEKRVCAHAFFSPSHMKYISVSCLRLIDVAE